ncbi:MAG: hypothetical protein ACRDD2_12330 [Sarcina sp.]
MVNLKKYNCLIIAGVAAVFLILFTILFFNKTIVNPLSLNVGFNKKGLTDLIFYSDLSGAIDNKYNIDVNLENIYINNGVADTTAFYQSNPKEKYSEKIYYTNKEYIMEQYLKGEEVGVFKFDINNKAIKGTYEDLKTRKIYNFSGSLIIYNSGKLLLCNNVNSLKNLYKDFLDYPFYSVKMDYVNNKKQKQTENSIMEYNAYKNQIIEYNSNSNEIYKIKPEQSTKKFGIDLCKYYKNKLLGVYEVYYSKGNWYGNYYNDKNKNEGTVMISGYYK